MSVLEDNLSALKKFHPDLYNKVREWAAQFETSQEYKSNGSVLITVKIKNGISSVYSFQDSINENAQAKAALSLSRPRILICNGVGTGEHLVEQKKNFAKSIRHFLLVERQPALFIMALKKYDYRDFIQSRSWHFMIGVEPDCIDQAQHEYLLNQARLCEIKKVGHWSCFSSLKVDGDYYVQFAKRFSQISQILNQSTQSPGEDNVRALTNLISNKDIVAKSLTVSDLQGTLDKIRAVVVAAGPSLKWHIEYLKSDLRKKIFVACCDGAVEVLEKNNIYPDALVCSERGIRQKEIFRQLSTKYKNIPLIALPSIHPEAIKLYPGPIVFARRAGTFGAWLWPSANIPDFVLGVSGAACAALIGLGCKTIGLLGQDLSYADSGSSHAEGVSLNVQEYVSWLDGSEIVHLKGNSGREVRSNFVWSNFLSEISSLAKQNTIVKIQNIIPSDCGALIPGTQRLNPDEFWLAQSQSADCRDLINDWVHKIHDKNNNSQQNINFDDLINKTKSVVMDLKESLSVSYEHVLGDFHNEIDLMPEYELMIKASHYIDSWHNACFEHFQNTSIDQFLSCLNAADHFKLTLEREIIQEPDVGKSWRKCVQGYWLKTLEWYRMQMAWCDIAIYYLEK